MIFRAGPGRERPGIEKLLIIYEAIINIIIIINSKRLQFLAVPCRGLLQQPSALHEYCIVALRILLVIFNHTYVFSSAKLGMRLLYLFLGIYI